MLAPLLAALCLAAAGAAAPEDSCVACHRTTKGVAYVQHDFADWRASPHGRRGISCDACHGGEPAQARKEDAHRGMLSSKEARSPVYYTRVPATCGVCHQAELEAFKKSAHYSELRKSGRGPNCVTCHGAMASHVLGPRDLERTCTLCHRKPTQAYEARVALDRTGAELKRLDAELKAGRSRGLDLSAQEQEHRAAAELYLPAVQQWHAFDMPKVLRLTADIERRVKAASAELHIKARQR